MKVKCVESRNRGFKVGNVYEYGDVFIDDTGYDWHHSEDTIESFNERNWYHPLCIQVAKFEEVKEMNKDERTKAAQEKIELAKKSIEKAQKELEEAQKELDKKEGYFEFENGQDYWYIESATTGFYPEKTEWINDYSDKALVKSGNAYRTNKECQRACDMINYQLLVRRKALEIDGLIGYGMDAAGKSSHVVFCGNGSDACTTEVSNWDTRQPMVPLLTKQCAARLKDDTEIGSAARKAWGK